MANLKEFEEMYEKIFIHEIEYIFSKSNEPHSPEYFNSILFVIDLNSFDNGLDGSIELIQKSIETKWDGISPFYVILNKMDLFEEKLKEKAIMDAPEWNEKWRDWKGDDEEKKVDMEMDIDSVQEGLAFFKSLIMDQFPLEKRDLVSIFEMDAFNDNDVKRVFDEITMNPFCGSILTQVTPQQAYGDSGASCDICRSSLPPLSVMWHCPRNNATPHSDLGGFDLCNKCIKMDKVTRDNQYRRRQ